jgi:hypothetical protein
MSGLKKRTLAQAPARQRDANPDAAMIGHSLKKLRFLALR